MASRDNRYSSTTSTNHQVSGGFFLKAVTIHGGVHLNQAQSERFYLHPNRPRLT